MGFCSGEPTANGPLPLVLAHLDINQLELRVDFNAVQSFASTVTNSKIRLFLDNNTAVCFINKNGGTRLRGLT